MKKTKNDAEHRKSGIRSAALAMIVVAVALIGLGGYIFSHMLREKEQQRMMAARVEVPEFYAGIRIDGQDVGGKTKEEAFAAVQSALDAADDQRSITVTYEDSRWVITADDFSYQYDTQKVVDDAYQIARSGPLRERYEQVLALEANGLDLYTTWLPGTLRMDGHVAQIAQALYIEPVDADVSEFNLATKAFTYSAEKSGRELDTEKLRADIAARFDARNMTEPVLAETREIRPQVALADIEGKSRFLAAFETVAAVNPARNENIRLCSGAFNGKRVNPGEVFSINEATGERTLAKGYKAAGAIVKGVLVEEPGGGVCQVSTTLMQATVRAGMEIVERGHHSWPSTYVPIGQDAAINWPTQDYKFKNISNGPVFLVSSFADQRLRVEVWGYPVLADNEYYDITSQQLSEHPAGKPTYKNDATLPAGTTLIEREERTGKKSETKLHLYRDGQIVETKMLFRDYYRPITATYRVGTKAAIAPRVPSGGGNHGGVANGGGTNTGAAANGSNNRTNGRTDANGGQSADATGLLDVIETAPPVR